MKTVYILFILVVWSTMCSARPNVVKANLHGALRAKRQAVMLRGMCPINQARLIRNCISCNRFEEITGKDCPGDPKYYRRSRKSGNKRSGTINIKRLDA